jgi:hypothetical protein
METITTGPAPGVELQAPDRSPERLQDHERRAIRALPRALPWADIGAVVGMLAGWRAALWLFALLSAYLARNIYPPSSADEFFSRTLLQGEALWHLWIGERGYDYVPGAPSTAAFPPLFALLVRLVALVVPSATVAGALVAHAATAAALAYLVALVRLDYDRATALRAVAAALLYPAAVFLGAVYPESTLLLTVTAALYHARRGQWGRAALWGALAGLTRGAGLLVLLPLIVEYVAQRARCRGATARGRVAPPLALALVPLPFLAFLGFLAWRTGSFAAHFLARDAFGRGSLLRPAGLATSWGDATGAVGPAAPAYPPAIAFFPDPLIPALLDGGLLLLFAGLGVWLLLRVRPSYGLFVLAGVAGAFAIGGLPGSNRHLLLLAPAYLALALLGRRPVVGYVAAMLGLMLLALTTFVYVNGHFAG